MEGHFASANLPEDAPLVFAPETHTRSQGRMPDPSMQRATVFTHLSLEFTNQSPSNGGSADFELAWQPISMSPCQQ